MKNCFIFHAEEYDVNKNINARTLWLDGLISYNIYYVLYLPFDRRRMNCVWVFSNCPIKHVNILTVDHNHISMFIEF